MFSNSYYIFFSLAMMFIKQVQEYRERELGLDTSSAIHCHWNSLFVSITKLILIGFLRSTMEMRLEHCCIGGVLMFVLVWT